MKAIVLVIPALLQFSAPDEPTLFPGLGSHIRKITTSSPQAQAYFNQGLRLLYGFNHGEALLSFTEAARHDPKAPMAWWGVAMSHGPHINYPVLPPEGAKSASAAIRKARALSARATAVERALIGAALKRYVYPQPKNRSGLDLTYANAMRRVRRSFPRDTDVGTLFAESMMDLRPWDLWKPDGTPQPGTPEVVRALESVLKLDPRHPGAVHFYIHAVEASPWPEKAITAADNLRRLQPSSGHMTHMPSHIDVRTGQWGKAVISNERAIDADNAYRAIRPRLGLYRVYMAHNHHMLSLAAMMLGQSVKAIGAIDALVTSVPDDWARDDAPFIDGFMAMPIEVRKRFGKWDEVLATPELPEYFPIARAMRRAGRSVAYAAKGDAKGARTEQSLFYEARKKVPAEGFVGNNTADKIMKVAAHLMNGEILVAEDHMDDACAELRLAVAAEDLLRYSEPPDWIVPTRHTLGAVLLKSMRYDEAEAVYREDLRRLPNDGWALFGLAKTLEARNKTAEAKRIRDKFDTLWADADVKITSSCMCLPGG